MVIAYIYLPELIISQIEEYCEVVSFHSIQIEKERFLNELKDCEGLIGAELPITEELLQKAPKLKIVSNISVGYDNFDLESMTRHGVMGTNTPGVTETTADAMMVLLLAAARRIPELDQFVKEKKWTNLIGMEHYGIDVHNRTLGIIGMGKIGFAVAKRAHFGFDMNILYHNRSQNKEREEAVHATYCELNELLRKSDFVLMMASANEGTRHLIGEEQFSLMQPNAIFINGSRGQNVDEVALVQALKKGHIYGAALDVFETEPISPDHELLQLKNVVTVPHIGSATFETRQRMVQMAISNLIQGIKSETPTNLLNQEVLKTH
ncbi:2-hydroxyacid dehydrogenase [Pseudogracilibacillus sp. ICA-222130]|uniref:2-hydroxyacid dehydrogenase n=1 Tax=Pseudogracilibacillus sp. ICA-222130 TaxID=3134655 RepID=UPI0030BEFFD3